MIRDNTLTTSTPPITSISSALVDGSAANGRIGHKAHSCRKVEGLVTRIGRGGSNPLGRIEKALLTRGFCFVTVSQPRLELLGVITAA
jgi:hypothetical protein